MSSNAGRSHNQAHETPTAQYLSPSPDDITPLEEVSDVESFSRTRPEESEEEDELDIEAPGVDGASRNGVTKEDGGNDSPLQLPSSTRHIGEATQGSNGNDPYFPNQSVGVSHPQSTLSAQDLQSSPGSSRPSSRNSTLRSHRRGSLKPFDRRFSGILSPSPLPSRNISPAFRPSHSRQSSLASTGTLIPSQDESDTPQPPWEVVRWTKLKKITGQVFSETGKRNYGRPTVMAIGASILIGTSKGLTLVFDYRQILVATIGLGTKAVESGSVTALAISADHSTIASGHATGHIFTWEIARPAKPFLQILPLNNSQLGQRTSDGHVSDSAVIHVGFLGTRHTALVSADNRGMAFSHLATRGLGAVARSVKTARVLGRYPPPPNSKEPSRKASSVLAFASLPLGNVEHATDSLGLTALVTPYLLVIVSTTPIAETQFKSPRPKEIPPHSTLSGCLAWFPAVKLKRPDPSTGQSISKTKLVYSWSHILTILDVEAHPSDEKDKPATLHFQPRSRWRSQEAIVAIQWLSRSILGILTISQRLIILEDTTMRVTDSFDLIQKHIYHQDIFSAQLRPVVEHLDEEDASLHGVVADAFYMSFRAYKGRLFILGFNDISIGTLSNWADRLTALIEGGDYVGAIRVAESYYAGDADKVSVGLPEDNDARHSLVQEKLLEMISASLKYVRNHSRAVIDDEDPLLREEMLHDLASATFSACLTTQQQDFLFEDVFDTFQEVSAEKVFFLTLEPYILSEEIQSVPTQILKTLIAQYAVDHRTVQLEELICHLDTRMMDIDQTATLCKMFRLYDALIHVWNQALQDYVTPLVELLQLAVSEELEDDPEVETSARKLFPYLAHVLTGRSYPSGLEMDDGTAQRAKTEVYGFLFSGGPVEWPLGSRRIFSTRKSNDGLEPPYPYLALILHLDAPSFLSMLNEAFEDHFLNGYTTNLESNSILPSTNGTKDGNILPTRQTIIGILLDVMTEGDFGQEDTVYLDMFIARNLPKFPQFIVLPGKILDMVLRRLCDYPSDELADDCQLSVEYLLSYYHPSDLENLSPVFRRAGFYRVLKSVYRAGKLYAQLMQVQFDDKNDQKSVFDCIGDCLRPGSTLTSKQIREVHSVIVANAQDLVAIDTARAAQSLATYAPQLVQPVFEALDEASHLQFMFLKSILDSPSPIARLQPTGDESLHHQFEENYVRLMCAYEPSRVADYIGLLKSGDLRLKEVLPAMESSGAIDAAVLLLARDGLVEDAMERLKAHMLALQGGVIGLIEAVTDSPDFGNSTEALDDILDAIQKYVKVGIWLCQGQTRITNSKPRQMQTSNIKRLLKDDDPEANLALDERLWLDFIDAIVNITKNISVAENMSSSEPGQPTDISSKSTVRLRAAVQDCFTALLNATARPSQAVTSAPVPAMQPHPSFLLILRAFLSRAATSSPSLSDLRAVIAEIFQAYAFEERILDLAHQFLDKDLFVHVEDAWASRQMGWRPRGNVCEGCGRRVWGPGVGSSVWESWESNMSRVTLQKSGRRRSPLALSEEGECNGRERGKGKAVGVDELDAEAELDNTPNGGEREDDAEEGRSDAAVQPLVVFACRHIWHRTCLEGVTGPGHIEGLSTCFANALSRFQEI